MIIAIKSGFVLTALVALAGCAYGPGYGYVRGDGYYGDAYYGEAYDRGPAYYNNGYYGYAPGGYYGGPAYYGYGPSFGLGLYYGGYRHHDRDRRGGNYSRGQGGGYDGRGGSSGRTGSSMDFEPSRDHDTPKPMKIATAIAATSHIDLARLRDGAAAGIEFSGPGSAIDDGASATVAAIERSVPVPTASSPSSRKLTRFACSDAASSSGSSRAPSQTRPSHAASRRAGPCCNGARG